MSRHEDQACTPQTDGPTPGRVAAQANHAHGGDAIGGAGEGGVQTRASAVQRSLSKLPKGEERRCSRSFC